MTKHIEGPAHSLLTDAKKHVCEFCNGSLFYIADTDADENTDLPADTKAWSWDNSTPTLPYANIQTLVLLCGTCGKISGKLLFVFDVIGGMATPVITATHIACRTVIAGGGGADNLKGLYLTPLGGTSKGISFIIASNTEADPTVITVTGAINDDVNGEEMLISSWKVF